MPDVGRIVCVAFPFVATLLALVTLLVATLGGKHLPSVYMFTVNLTDLSVDPQGIEGILDNIQDTVTDAIPSNIQDALETLPTSIQNEVEDLNLNEQIERLTGHAGFVTKPPGPNRRRNTAEVARDVIDDILSGGANISAADLGLQNIYHVSLWGTCSGADGENTTCSTPEWDWASKMLNTTWLENVGRAMGANISLPDEVKNGLEAFNTSIKWLQIVFVASLGLLALELFFGLWSSCSRIWSCLAYVVAGIATTVLTAAAIFATVVTAAVVGVLKGSAEIYGADANFNTTFLSLIWASVALAIIAGLFWCITACCCANKRDGNSRGFSEKRYSSSSYEPLGHNAAGPAYAQQTGQVPQQTGAYEPYSHRV
jgi:hypothetical protein